MNNATELSEHPGFAGLMARAFVSSKLTPVLILASLLLGLLFFAFVGKMLRVIMWGAMVGPAMCHPAMARSWRHPRHWMHGPMPPWHGPWHEQPGERPQEGDSRANAEA